MNKSSSLSVTDTDKISRFITRLAENSVHTLASSAELSIELTAIGIGASTIEPEKSDRRFNNPAWRENPSYRRWGQAYLAWARTLEKLPDQLEMSEWRKREQIRFVLGLLTSAAAPTNSLIGNPEAIEKAFQTGGKSLIKGTKNWLIDLISNRGMPTQVDSRPFKIGVNTAITPGSVVYRTEVFELIEYTPTTDTVRERPLLLVPPMIGKYYFLDLSNERSLIEHAVNSGLHFFNISWRNPDKNHSMWDLDTYASAIIEAIEVIKDISGAEQINTHGFCAGGLVLACALNYLQAQGNTPVHATSFGVMLLDFDIPLPLGAFSHANVLSYARNRSTKKGLLPPKDMAAAFTWMRPNDLVWNYWHNNYLMGESPPSNDIMAWNADGTRLPAALHHQFLDIFEKNALYKRELSVLRTPFKAGQIKCDSYFMAAIADHLTPWKSCYQTSKYFDGDRTFVLSNAGHIAGIVNPPNNPKAHHLVGPAPTMEAEEWLEEATKVQGSWWKHWTDWIIQRSGAEKPAPKTLGNSRHPVLEDAPGLYIHG